MGIDLRFYVIPPRGNKWWLGNNQLVIDQDSRVFDAIEAACQPHPLPPGVCFTMYTDHGIQDQETDPYGQPLTYVLAEELAERQNCRTIAPSGRSPCSSSSAPYRPALRLCCGGTDPPAAYGSVEIRIDCG